MRKGNLVRFDKDYEEVKRATELALVYGSPQPVRTYRPTTHEERQAWREEKSRAIEQARLAGKDTFSIAFDDGGESRLPPRSKVVNLPVDGVFIVERARCRVELGWGRSEGGYAKILCTQTGESTYVKRASLEVVS